MKSWMRFVVVFLMLVSSYSINLGLITSAHAENQNELWQTVKSSALEVQEKLFSGKKLPSNYSYENAQIMTLNVDLMRDYLNLDNGKTLTSAEKKITQAQSFEISVPLPDGSIIDLTVTKDALLPEQLAAKFPDINTYRVLANKDVFAGKVDISDSGFHAMLHMMDGETVFIDPVDLGQHQYAVFAKSEQKSERTRQHACTLKDDFDSPSFSLSNKLSAKGGDGNEFIARPKDSLITYKIAIATTPQYSAKFGGSVDSTMRAITTTISRVNQVLERDLGIRLTLVENNDLLINTGFGSNPFTETKLMDLVFQNQDFIDSVIGNANYDIGHLFTTSGGGLAAIASACNIANKAKAASGITSPRGDSFDLDFVAHEIGHQLGATHTFNSTQGACSADTRTPRTAFEPGSGSSIMSYAGYCGLDNIQSNTDAMFHIGSIKQISNYTKRGVGNRCGVDSIPQNKPPIVDAGRDYTIPARTPFELAGSAIDEDGDELVYAWEQLDAGDTSTQSADKGNNALFRVHAPNKSIIRSFPPLVNVLNRQPAKGETLPSYQRNLSMSFVAQDNINPAQSDEMTVKVVRTGSRFALNYPRAYYALGDTYPIYWNVANTDKTPVNCSTIDVSLSLDGGQSFNYSLANNILNNGEALVTIPTDAYSTTNGRFKIKCSDNVFFAVSHRNFFVTDNPTAITLSYANEDLPETNLADLPLNTETTTSSAGVNTNSDNSGGGPFNLIFYLLFFVFIRNYFSRSN